MKVLKSIFRKANTQFKRSMKVFTLDKFVTENVNMLLDQNKLYECLAKLEPKKKRFYQMLLRRKKLLAPLETLFKKE